MSTPTLPAEATEQPARPRLVLSGQNGNAFMVLALASKAAKKAGWNAARIGEFMIEAKSGDYDNLLRVCMEHFDVQ